MFAAVHDHTASTSALETQQGEVLMKHSYVLIASCSCWCCCCILLALLAAPGTRRPCYVVGIVEITEEDSDSTPTADQQAATQLQQIVLQALLVCALYARQHTVDRKAGLLHSSTGGGNSSSSRDAEPRSAALDDFCGSIVHEGLLLSTPWTSSACQEHCDHILHHLASAVVLPDDPANQQRRQHGICSPAATVKQKQQQQEERQEKLEQHSWQQLLSGLLPLLLDRLRDALMAQHRHMKAQDRGELGEPHKCLRHLLSGWGGRRPARDVIKDGDAVCVEQHHL